MQARKLDELWPFAWFIFIMWRMGHPMQVTWVTNINIHSRVQQPAARALQASTALTIAGSCLRS